MSIYFVIAVLLILFLVLNVMMRLYVFKIYRSLVKQRVDFEPAHFFNKKRLEEEILPKYPDAADEIKKFVWLVRFSMTMATIILALILYLGYYLIKTQS